MICGFQSGGGSYLGLQGYSTAHSGTCGGNIRIGVRNISSVIIGLKISEFK
jgi:hypothetical protein